MNKKPNEMLKDYLTAFESFDPASVAAHYHLPSLFLAAAGVLPISDLIDARGLASMLIE